MVLFLASSVTLVTYFALAIIRPGISDDTRTHTHTHTNASNVVIFITASKPVCYELTCITGDNYEQEHKMSATKNSEIYLCFSRYLSLRHLEIKATACTIQVAAVSNSHGCNLHQLLSGSSIAVQTGPVAGRPAVVTRGVQGVLSLGLQRPWNDHQHLTTTN